MINTKTTKTLSLLKDPEAKSADLDALLDHDTATNRLLARHPRSSQALLEKLSHASDPDTRRGVTANPNTSPEILIKLGQQFPKAFLSNPALDLMVMANPGVVRDFPEALLLRLLKRPECPVSLLRWAVNLPGWNVQLAVAMNPQVPPDVRDKLRGSWYEEVHAGENSKDVDYSETNPEQAFGHSVCKKLVETEVDYLYDAWEAGDIGLVHWSVLPMSFRMAISTTDLTHRHQPWFSPKATARLVNDLEWPLESLPSRYAFNNYNDPGWTKVKSLLNLTAPRILSVVDDMLEDTGQFEGWWFAASYLLESPHVPANLFDLLSNAHQGRYKDEVVRLYVTSEWCPTTVLEQLAKDKDKYVRRAVAENANATPSVLELLAADKSIEVRGAVLRNNNVPLTVATGLIEQLSQRTELHLQLAVASSRWANGETLKQLSASKKSEIRVAVARNTCAPEQVLMNLATDRELSVREGVVANARKNETVLLHWLKFEDRKSARVINIVRRLSEDPETPLAFLQEVVADDLIVRQNVAKRPDITSDMMALFAQDADIRVRESLAKDRCQSNEVSRQTFEDLVKDNDSHGRMCAATSPDLPLDLFSVLLKDKNDIVVALALENPSVPADVLATFSPKTRHAKAQLVAHPNTPISILLEHVSDNSDGVQLALAAQAHRAPQLFDAVLANASDNGRLRLMSSEALTSGDLDRLAAIARSEKEFVTLIENPKLSASTCLSVAERLLYAKPLESWWYQQSLAKAPPEVQKQVESGEILSYVGKAPEKTFLAKRRLAPLMALLGGPHIKPELLARGLQSTDWLVRAALARNQGTPPNFLKKLLTDAHPLVSALAKQHLANLEQNQVGHSGLVINQSRVVQEVVSRLSAPLKVRPRNTFGTEIIPKFSWDALLFDTSWGKHAPLSERWRTLTMESLEILRAELQPAAWEHLMRCGVNSADPQVRATVSKHPACSLEWLRTLADDKHIDVVMGAITNPSWPECGRKNGKVFLPKAQEQKLLLAKHKDATPEQLDILSKDTDALVRSGVAANNATPPSLLAVLAKDKVPDVRRGVASNPSCPLPILVQLAELKTLKFAAAANPCCPEDIRLSILDALPLAEAVKNPGCPASLLAKHFSLSKGWVECHALLDHPNCSSELFEMFAQWSSKEYGLDREIAFFKSLNPGAMISEAREREFLERIKEGSFHRLSKSHACAPDVLREMAQQTDTYFHHVVAKHPNAPADVLMSLATSPNWQLRQDVLSNPRIPDNLRQRMYTDAAAFVVEAMGAAHPELTGRGDTPVVGMDVADLHRGAAQALLFPKDPDNKALTAASRSTDWLTRFVVATHPQCSKGQCELLCRDVDADVSKAAQLRSATFAESTK